MAKKFGKRPGVTILETDKSVQPQALGSTLGVMALYAEKGPTDGAYLCRSTSDIARLFTVPHVKMKLASDIYDYGYGLHTAFKMVDAGLPLWIHRAKPSASFASATSIIWEDEALPSKKVLATAKGHGKWYNDLRIVIRGLANASRKLDQTSTAIIDLGDYVLPRSVTLNLKDADATSLQNDENYTSGNVRVFTFGLAIVTLTYRNTLYGNRSTVTLSGTLTTDFVIKYQKTNASGAVKLLVTTKQELDKTYLNGDYAGNPDTNALETFVVSYKEDGVNESGNGIFIEDVINAQSELFTVDAQAGLDTDLLPIATTSAEKTNAIQFTGDTSSTVEYPSNDAAIATALQEFESTAYDFLYAFDAGYNDTVKVALAQLCQKRLWPHAYIDPPKDKFLTDNKPISYKGKESNLVDDLVDWRMTLALGEAAEWASLSGTTWGQTTDVYNGGKKIWLPPTYEVGALAIGIDESIGSWNTVAGPRRGVTGFEKLVVNLYDYRDILVAKQVNPLIVDERGVQMYYGNSTMKIVSSAMQNTHARKTRGRLSREYYFACLDYNWELQTTDTINDLYRVFERIHDKYAGALESVSVVVGPPKTTTADIANKTLRIGVLLVFFEVAEEIAIETTVYGSGTDLAVQVA